MSDAAATRVAIPQRAQPATRDSRAKVMREFNAEYIYACSSEESVVAALKEISHITYSSNSSDYPAE